MVLAIAAILFPRGHLAMFGIYLVVTTVEKGVLLSSVGQGCYNAQDDTPHPPRKRFIESKIISIANVEKLWLIHI